MISQSNFYSSLLPTLSPCLPPSVPPSIGMLGISSGPECTNCALYHCRAISSLQNSYCLLQQQLMIFPATTAALSQRICSHIPCSSDHICFLMAHTCHDFLIGGLECDALCWEVSLVSSQAPPPRSVCLVSVSPLLQKLTNNPFRSLKAECPADLVNHSVLCSTSESSQQCWCPQRTLWSRVVYLCLYSSVSNRNGKGLSWKGKDEPKKAMMSEGNKGMFNQPYGLWIMTTLML